MRRMQMRTHNAFWIPQFSLIFGAGESFEFIRQMLTSLESFLKVRRPSRGVDFLHNLSPLLSFGNLEQEINSTRMTPLTIFTASVSLLSN